VQAASNSVKWCSRPKRVSPPNRAHGIAVGRGTWAATQQVAEVTAIHWYEAHGIGRREFKLKLPFLDAHR